MKVAQPQTQTPFHDQYLTELLQDGIHIDMDRLKKGEVKYELPILSPRSLLTLSQSRNFDVRSARHNKQEHN